MKTRHLAAIVAMDEGRIIGSKGELPWRIPQDMKRFKALTSGHAVLMGRKTFESLPPEFKPLPDRMNIVVTRNPSNLAKEQGIIVWDSPSACIRAFLSGALSTPTDTLWIIGGAEIYKETIHLCDEVYLTLVHGHHEGDARLEEFEDKFQVTWREDHNGYSFITYGRIVTLKDI